MAHYDKALAVEEQHAASLLRKVLVQECVTCLVREGCSVSPSPAVSLPQHLLCVRDSVTPLLYVRLPGRKLSPAPTFAACFIAPPTAIQRGRAPTACLHSMHASRLVFFVPICVLVAWRCGRHAALAIQL